MDILDLLSVVFCSWCAVC